ncbi:MAG: helix-turn-helix domain-containing protein [Ottowia sp.]|uniref:MarR family winged helix-turn-helix transcriptional regulator n=1 Tax=Ottowia sp. TaxID=1898956 RepID=UPI0039E42958
MADLQLHRIRAIAVSVGSLAEKLMLAEVGISVMEARVLQTLRAFPASTATEVAGRILLTTVQVGRSVARLKKLGLLKVEPHALDGRALHLELTAAGEIAHAAAVNVTAAVQAWTIRDLSREEWIQLDLLLNKLVESSQYGERDIRSLQTVVSEKQTSAKRAAKKTPAAAAAGG